MRCEQGCWFIDVVRFPRWRRNRASIYPLRRPRVQSKAVRHANRRNEVKSPPFGIVDTSWPMFFKEAGFPCEIVYVLPNAWLVCNQDTAPVVFPQQDIEFAKKYGYGERTVPRALQHPQNPSESLISS